MAKQVLIIQNILREGPGRISQILAERGLASRSILAQDGGLSELLQESALQDYGAVLILGGPASANDKSSWMLAELELARRVLALDLPSFGICLGLQVLVKAGGGGVVENHPKEIGFVDDQGRPHSIELNQAGQLDPLCRGVSASTRIFQLHGETVELTADMTGLATSRHCAGQLVRVGPRAYGIQGHLELTRDLLSDWLAADPDLASLDATSELQRFDVLEPELERSARKLFSNFLELAGL